MNRVAVRPGAHAFPSSRAFWIVEALIQSLSHAVGAHKPEVGLLVRWRISERFRQSRGSLSWRGVLSVRLQPEN